VHKALGRGLSRDPKDVFGNYLLIRYFAPFYGRTTYRDGDVMSYDDPFLAMAEAFAEAVEKFQWNANIDDADMLELLIAEIQNRHEDDRIWSHDGLANPVAIDRKRTIVRENKK